MRVHGCIESAGHLGLDGHACWAFEQRDEFTSTVLEFLTEGLRLGQRIAFMGDEPIDEQRERLGALGEVGELADSGALLFFNLRDLYPKGRAVDFEDLRAETGLPVEELEDALHHMAASGLVERVGRSGYAIPDKN